ncbi:MAG: hypothetical protein GF332_01695 [Candidatus Moranbacteria bacterium]|nr:hypothetical protein [Candidatus Moranbacteria bacterium]
MKRKKTKQYRLSFPHMGNYHITFKTFFKALDLEIVIPPPISKQTIELGSRYSPESVCVPFKYNLGNYIQALDRGANLLLQAGGGCRYGYYGEAQKHILENLGYDFEFFKLRNKRNPINIIGDIHKINPKIPFYRVLKAFLLAYFKGRCIEKAEDFLRKNIGFEKKKGQLEKQFKFFLSKLDQAETFTQARQLTKKYLRIFENIPILKPKNLLRVGVVGEFYVVLEPFSNYNIEKFLASKGVEVHRFITLTGLLNHSIFNGIIPNHEVNQYLRHAKPFLKYHIGGHGTDSVGKANELAKKGFDGAIHIKPFGCIPEVNAMPALQNISKKYNFPIIYLSFDAQTSDTGMQTRLEAFYDMLTMKKNATKK